MKSGIKTVKVKLSDRSYPIYIGANVMRHTDLWLPEIEEKKVFIVADKTTSALYAPLLVSVLKMKGVEAEIYELTPGEKSKSFFDYQMVLEWMIENGLNRNSYIFALGGGVIGDLAGFVAATALRGIKFLQIPTTLLAQVDSSVGGKTGINSKSGKNLIGAFYQPQNVVIDVQTLETLPLREMLAGYAEIVKYGLLGDAKFFKWLEANGEKLIAGDTDARIHAVEQSVMMKADIVKQDEFETNGLRALLNLGHTFAHALETACGYDGRLLHGEAVGIGLVLAARLSTEIGYLQHDDAVRIQRHLKDCGMMTEIRDIQPAVAANAHELFALMCKDKKANSKGITFVVLKGIGKATLVRGVPEKTVLKVLEGSMK